MRPAFRWFFEKTHMTLILHRGAEPVAYDDLRLLPVPEPTATHVPIPHYRIIDIVKHMLAFYKHEVVEEHHGVTPDGARYFGCLTLRSTYGDYSDMLGLRNSHDKSMPIGLAFGSRVMVCDNMAFSSDYVVTRKHTINAKHILPSLISGIVEPLALQREAQRHTFSRYRCMTLKNKDAYNTIIELYNEGVINLQRIPDVLEQWRAPKHQEWIPGSAYHLFNAVTYVLSGRVAENPSLTKRLHAVIQDCYGA